MNSNQSNQNEDKYEQLLRTSNVDREIEYFWYHFKDVSSGFLKEDEKKRVMNLSE